MWILPLLLQTWTIHERIYQGFTLTDFSKQLMDIRDMGYSANNVFPYFTDPINFDNSFFRCHFCEQLIFLSLLSYLCTKSSWFLVQSSTRVGLSCNLQQMISVFKPWARIFLSLSWAVYVQIKKQKEKV